MKKTFVCDESMIITIPIGSLNDAREGQLMPEKFRCVYKDSYKVFALNGKPKPLGAAQALAGVFIITLGQILDPRYPEEQFFSNIYTLPSVVYLCYTSWCCCDISVSQREFVVSGMLSYAAGRSPNMHVTKLSFSLNIISLFWSLAAVCVCGLHLVLGLPRPRVHEGIRGLILTLLVVETLMAVFLIYWLSKAVCRQSFNTLPIILLKQGD